MHPLQQIKRANWPPLINQLAETLGDETALKLFIRFTGRHLAVPKNRIPGHVIDQTIGEEKTKLLIKQFGGEDLRFPNGRKLIINERNNKIVELFLDGMRQGDIATLYDLTERQINTIVNNHKDINNQKVKQEAA
jgi:Mor family transcriptional regulator